jgi:GPH family glycoside/pentoside/hexuronide:cation symporter
MPEVMSIRRQIAYCLGGLSWQITSTLVVSVGIYYYLPPEGAGLEVQLSEEIFLGVLTAYGLARLIGGIADSMADPFVGHFSDVSKSRFGRRRAFMIFGAVPMVATSALIFWPMGEPGSTETFAYLSIVLAAYYVFFTVYVGPYLALVPEIARTEQERIDLSRLRALVTGPLMMFFSFMWLKGIAMGRDAGMETEESVRLVVIISSAIALVCSILPILAVDEERHVAGVPSDLDWRASMKLTLKNRPLMTFLVAEVVMILGATMMGPALPYFARVLLGRDEAFAATLGLAILPSITVGFIFIDRISERLGAKTTMAISMLVLGLSMLPLGLMRPAVPGGEGDAFNLAVIIGSLFLSGIPLAAMMVIPMVLLGQLIDLDEARTGSARAAMFFGVQGLMTKWVYAASAAILSYLFAKYGRSTAEPMGIILLGPVGGTICLISAAIFSLYPEGSVSGQIEALRKEAPDAPIPPAQPSIFPR